MLYLKAKHIAAQQMVAFTHLEPEGRVPEAAYPWRSPRDDYVTRIECEQSVQEPSED